MKRLVKLVKLNHLPYNVNRDPQVYRRCAGEPFHIQALLDGTGQARCRLTDERGASIAEAEISLPGTFTHTLAYSEPGVHLVTLTCEGNGLTFCQDLRLDVLERAWVG
ncbi:MAG: hypothetical protein DI596_10700 [Azospira oryzae]|nr:MAG: hypothetical protein DI596_10700 [Azospira oryzae]PZP78302.1 MAG: hypothetical protein DI593_10700 [Azospira oryzae]